jgi:type III pantothenate kinase
MLLAINANNTNTKFAVFDGERMLDEWRIYTQAARTADEYAVWLSQLMNLKGRSIDAIHATLICTVVPQALFNLRLLCQNYFKSEPLVIGDPKVKLGIKALVDRPSEVGADRLGNAVGASVLFPGQAAIVVDFGTSTNFDVVDVDGNFCGGIIAPGINLSLEALHMATAQLPRIALAKPSKVIGTNTLGCMQSGVFWGYVGLVEGLVSRMKAEWGKPMTVISTGGLAPLFVGATDVIDHQAPDITMRGLFAIYQRNESKRA